MFIKALLESLGDPTARFFQNNLPVGTHFASSTIPAEAHFAPIWETT
jgi:hypothetical protein